MAGWWAEFPGQKPPDLSFSDWQGYGIVDGPEIDVSVPPDLPLEGTANYAGMAGGLYRYSNEDIDVIDEWEGVLTLTADFADRSVSGCIGCVGDLVTRRAHFRTFLGDEVVDRDGLAKDYELHLGTAILEDNSAFERDRVTVRHPSRTVVRSDGGWGGSLSNRPDADGNPRLAAGFGWVSFEEADGSGGRFFGTFVGLSETFAKTPRLRERCYLGGRLGRERPGPVPFWSPRSTACHQDGQSNRIRNLPVFAPLRSSSPNDERYRSRFPANAPAMPSRWNSPPTSS